MRRNAKAIAAAIGVTLNAVCIGWVTVEIALSDGQIGFDEIGSIAAAASTLVGTVVAVWRTENRDES